MLGAACPKTNPACGWIRNVKSASGANLRRSRRLWFQPDPIIDHVVETLFAPQISLCCLHRYVSQQKLNLLQFTAALMAQAGATSTQVVRRERGKLPVLCLLLHYTPNHLRTGAGARERASGLGPRNGHALRI
jgi:hypothetical protein